MGAKRWIAAGLGTAAAIALVLTWNNPWARAWLKGHSVHTFDRLEHLDRSAANYVFDLDRIQSTFRFDPVSLLLFHPDQEQRMPWPEHPQGSFVMRTNGQGLREDREIQVEKRGPRVLVAGDSHTAGVVNNHETLAKRLEQNLRGEPGLSELEVVNAAVPHTGPYCYRRVLDKWGHLDPDLFLVVLFLGNDLWDDLKIGYVLDGWSPPRGDQDYTRRISKAAERSRGPINQGLNQCYRFKHFPWEADRSLDAVEHSMLAIGEECQKRGIRLVTLLLPTKADVEPESDADVLEAVCRDLEITREEASLNAQLGSRLQERLEAAGIETLYPLEAMRAAPEPLYWKLDHHLGLAGHDLLARLLEPVVLAGLRSRL